VVQFGNGGVLQPCKTQHAVLFGKVTAESLFSYSYTADEDLLRESSSGLRQLAERLDAFRKLCGSRRMARSLPLCRATDQPRCADMATDSAAPNRCAVCSKPETEHRRETHDYQRETSLPEWHAFRRGLASNLNRLGVNDSAIQAILRHSTVAVTQRWYMKTVQDDAVVAMRTFSKHRQKGFVPGSFPKPRRTWSGWFPSYPVIAGR
jgi:hypothetical protein